MSLIKKLEQDLHAFIQKIEHEFQGHGETGDDAALHAKVTEHVTALQTTLATAAPVESAATDTAPATGAETDPSAPTN
jgi:hypothetical protein